MINVTRKIINSVDSGFGDNIHGNVWWAYIDYVQQIKVVETAPGEFCATVKSQGQFESVGGDGPGCNTDASDDCLDQLGLAPGVTGTFQGGYTNTFKGMFSPDSMRTKGNIGTLDHDCDATTATGCSEPGFSAWRSEYFTAVTGSKLDWWGWVYHAGKNGSWVNGSDGSEGNITGD